MTRAKYFKFDDEISIQEKGKNNVKGKNMLNERDVKDEEQNYFDDDDGFIMNCWGNLIVCISILLCLLVPICFIYSAYRRLISTQNAYDNSTSSILTNSTDDWTTFSEDSKHFQ